MVLTLFMLTRSEDWTLKVWEYTYKGESNSLQEWGE